MESTFAIQGKDFVIVIHESTIMHSIFKLKENQDKTFVLDNHLVLGLTGDLADQREFGSMIQGNLQFLKFKHKKQLSVDETANFIRNKLSEALRKGPFQVNCLIGGYDSEGPHLYWMDYMGTMQRVSYGAHGYASYFVSSIMANSYTNELTLDQALEIAKQCVFELRKRMMVAQDHFMAKLVTAEGIKTLTV